MVEPAYHFCPRCGGKLEIIQHEGREAQACTVCHEILYKNQNVTVDGIIIAHGRLLLGRRGRDPQINFLDIPGGFVDADEKPQDGVVREMKEELGVSAKVIRLLGVYGPSPYLYRQVRHYNSDVIYLLDIGDQRPIAADDMKSLEWFSLNALPYGKLAFGAQNEFLEDVRTGKVDLTI